MEEGGLGDQSVTILVREGTGILKAVVVLRKLTVLKFRGVLLSENALQASGVLLRLLMKASTSSECSQPEGLIEHSQAWGVCLSHSNLVVFSRRLLLLLTCSNCLCC